MFWRSPSRSQAGGESEENRVPSRNRPGLGGLPGAGAAWTGSLPSQSAQCGARYPRQAGVPEGQNEWPPSPGGFARLQGAVWTVMNKWHPSAFSGNLARVEGAKSTWARGTWLSAVSLLAPAGPCLSFPIGAHSLMPGPCPVSAGAREPWQEGSPAPPSAWGWECRGSWLSSLGGQPIPSQCSLPGALKPGSTPPWASVFLT